MTVIDEALGRLRNVGWIKEEYGPPEGPHCIAGAVIAADAAMKGIKWQESKLGWVRSDWHQAVEEVIREQFPDRSPGYVTDFNDHPDTTFEDVEIVMEKASLRLQEIQDGHSR